jgi:exopolyphosphatase/guanosine-5'-triphosphate,3'-diphosphate pyrophosphatase
MPRELKFAAIDIGSNAVRLLLSRALATKAGALLRRDSFVRMPLRLGEDVFTRGKISTEKAEQLASTMAAFSELIHAYGARDYKACATSAMREAKNGARVVRKIKRRSGLDVEIVDGRREAEIVYGTHAERRLGKQKAVLYVDVGGGSTELTLLSNGRKPISSSFKIGTVRILKNRDRTAQWRHLKTWVVRNCSAKRSLAAIGSGGSINAIFKFARRKEGQALSYKQLKALYGYLKGFSLEERIRVLGLRPDRADVIVPAARIYLSIMKWSKIKRLYVPQIGLADGLVRLLYERRCEARRRG